jgi:ADP-ribosylglycohydrolase
MLTPVQHAIAHIVDLRPQPEPGTNLLSVEYHPESLPARRILAALEGAALGDAFGWALEDADPAVWLGRDPTGNVLRGLVPVGGREGLAGDGTQQLLFVAEGLLRAHNASTASRGAVDPVPHVHAALLRWLGTQRGAGPPPRPDGWLVGQPALHARRARSAPTRQALASGLCGRRERAVNNFVESGPALRGLVAGVAAAPPSTAGWRPWDLGCDLAAVTHGNPRVHVAAGTVAVLSAALVAGVDWESALDATWAALADAGEPGAALSAALDRALEQADLGDPGPARLSQFGDGRDPESALAIALYCVAVSPPGDAVGLAVLHAGAADRTGALAGGLAGARWGAPAVPPEAARLELAPLVRQVARDLFEHFAHGPFFEPSEADWSRYPA